MTPSEGREAIAPPGGTRPLPGTVKLLAWASFLNDIASEMLYTQLPRFLLDVLGANKLFLGAVEGVGETVASLVKLWSGARTDRTGRRKRMVLLGYSLAALSRPLIAISTSPWHLFGLRLGDRIGKGLRTSPRDALIADVTDRSNRGRAFGFHRGMDHLGAAIGPLAAALFLLAWPDALRVLFGLALIPGIAVVWLVLKLPERPAAPQPAKTTTLSLRPFARGFRLFLVAILIFTLGNSADLFLLVRAAELGVPQQHLPLLWSLFHVAKSLGNMLAGPLVDRVGPKFMLLVGWMIYLLVYVLFGLADSAWHVWLLFLAYAIYYACAEPAEKTLVVNLADPAHQGLAFGWFHLITGLGALPASLLFGAIYQEAGAMAAFGLGAGLAAVSWVLLATLPNPSPSSPPSIA